MRASLFLFFCLCAPALLAADDHPKIDGKVGTVSEADIKLITGAAKWWLQRMHAQEPGKKTVDTLSSIHILSHNRADVHLKQAYPKDGSFIEMTLTVRRTSGRWKADDSAALNTWGSL